LLPRKLRPEPIVAEEAKEEIKIKEAPIVVDEIKVEKPIVAEEAKEEIKIKEALIVR